ncbi:nucleoside hydrolase, partial [uncultured Muribaculum sp.]|uniref:nucleoside hydrolase n=1 Tax=uncultured Muribaculum sp. TaxID=1918613 RepID=UPI00272B42C5
MRKIIMDCDPGHDDAIALLLASRSDDLKILGVTTVAGNSELENTTRNARKIFNRNIRRKRMVHLISVGIAVFS